MKGTVHLTHRRADEILAERAGRNLIVNQGFNHTVEMWNPNAFDPAKVEWIALGSSGNAVDLEQTSLVAEIAGSRTQVGAITARTHTLLYAFTVTATASWLVQEAGLFNDAAFSSGRMVSRWIFQQVNMVLNDQLDVLWEIEFSARDIIA